MNALQSAAEPYNTALNQNTPVGKELDDIRRGMNYAGTFYDSITRAIARVKRGEQAKATNQDINTEITQEEAIEIANNYIKLFGIDLEGYEIKSIYSNNKEGSGEGSGYKGISQGEESQVDFHCID